MMNIRLTIFLLVSLSLLSGCRSQKEAARPAPAEIPAEIPLQTPQQRMSALCAAYADWEDLSVPIKASVTAKNGLGCSGKAAMKRGEWISISLRMLGFEVASVWVGTDSVHAVDRYHKMYLSESIGEIFGNAGVTVTDIQDLLLGRAFLAGPQGGTLSAALLPSFHTEQAPEGLMMLPVKQPESVEYGFILSPDVNTVAGATVGIAGKYPVTVAYSGFVNTLYAGSFASVADIDFPARKISGSIRWEFEKARWNTGLTNRWTAPRGYRRISGRQLLQTLSSF